MIKKILFICMVLCISQLSCMDTLNDAFNSKSGLADSMVYVPAGTFQRDSTATNTSYVSAFYMAKYEVTQAQYKAVIGSIPSGQANGIDTSAPVGLVSWYSALVFCNKLSMREGLTPVYTISGSTNPDDWGTVPTSTGSFWDAAICNMNASGYRLPTAMEWQWAAMGATSDARSGDIVSGVNTGGYTKKYSGSLESGNSNIGDYAWSNANSGGPTHPVGTRLANELGIFDLTGNVWEWCLDLYAVYPDGLLADYTGAGTGTNRTFLGASVEDDLTSYFLAGRLFTERNPTSNTSTVGLRVVRSAGAGYIPRIGLVGEWLFEGNAYDTSGSGANGTLSNSPSLTTDRKGNSSAAYSFASSQQISVASSAVKFANHHPFSISVWFNADASATGGAIVAMPGSFTNEFSYGIVLATPGGVLEVQANIATCNVVNNSNVATSVSAGNWHHAVMIYDGTGIALYLNGRFIGSTPQTITPTLLATSDLSIAGISGSSFIGKLDSVRIFNRALSAAEVAELYNE